MNWLERLVSAGLRRHAKRGAQGKTLQDASGQRQAVTLSLTESLKFWAARNRCDAQVEVRDLPESGRSAGTRVRVLASRACAADSEVSLYAIIGGGHNWPGVEGVIAPRIAGRVNLDIHASEVVWSFFEGDRGRP